MDNIQEMELYIEKLNFSMRTYNCLKKNNINTVEELLEATEDKLKGFRNLGTKSLEEIKRMVFKLTYGDFEFDTLIDNNNNIISNDELTILDIIADTDKKISKVLFCDENERYIDDIRIEDISLSVRSLNALENSGYEYASQLLELKIVSLNKVKNLGEKSKGEIIDKLKSIVYIAYDEQDTTKVEFINELSKILLLEYEQSLVEYNEEILKKNIYSIIKTNLNITDADKEIIEELIISEEFLCIIYNNNFLINLVKSHIFMFVKKMAGLVELSHIKKSLPNHLKNSDILKNIIKELIKENRIEQVEGNYRVWYPTLSEYVNSLEDDREKVILYNRFRGKTLEETGKELELTRERIRQLEKKAVNKIPIIREDEYKEKFEKYDWSLELFEYSYNESDFTYGYLKSKYNKGKISPEFMLEDDNIPIQVRLRAEKIIFKDYIIIGSSRIKKDRHEILDYILRTYCKDDVTSSDLSELYYMFLEDYGLEKDSEIMYPERYFETTLANSKKVLWKYGKKLRYYDFNELNPQKIVEALNLNEFEDVEYSTFKFFNNYSEIMKEWDIRDEYELHNLMKKSFEEGNEYNITLSRMPIIEFGKPDRSMQVLDLLLQTAPIENYHLAEVYEHEYGVKANTVLANYFQCIDEYYHNGIYSIDSEPLVGEEFDKMKEKLVDDVYFIKDVKEMYVDLFPKGDSKLINPYNLKRLGFRVNAKIIYSDNFTNSEEYFRTIMLRNEIFDATLLDSRLTCSPVYYNALQSLKANFDIIEFLPNKFVNIKRLETKGIRKENLQGFIDDVYEFVGDDFFTIKSLRKRGFEHGLDELGFDDWFYGGLLRCDTRFKYRRFDRNVLFRKGVDVITLNDLVEHIVYRYRSIDIYDLIEYIKEEYGIKMEKYKIAYIAKEKELYYDAIMEKIYIDYDEYFEEV